MPGVRRAPSLVPEDRCLLGRQGAVPLSKSSQALLPEPQRELKLRETPSYRMDGIRDGAASSGKGTVLAAEGGGAA